VSKVCDLCNAPTVMDGSRVYSSSEFRSFVTKGLKPPSSELLLYSMMGMSSDQALTYWKSNVVNTSTTDWLLCPSCAAKADNIKNTNRQQPQKQSVTNKSNTAKADRDKNKSGGKISVVNTSPNESAKSTNQTESVKPANIGCFIATACYGNHEANEVLILRQFRDKTLLKYQFGRWFVDFYYLISPSLSKWLTRHNNISSLIRTSFLDKLVGRISKMNT